MARAYAGAAGTHMFFGLLSISAGIAWIVLLYYYDSLFVTTDSGDKISLLTIVPTWVIVLLSAKIICGFWVSNLFFCINSVS